MSARKNVTAKRLRPIGSDLKKVDAYVLTQADYDEIPELTDEDFARADLYHGHKLVSRGRPKAEVTKAAVSLRIDPDVIAHYRGTGRGWQSRVNEILRRAAKLPVEKKAKKA